MVSGNRVSAVLCSTDLEKSQDFYERKVGLRLSPATIKNHLVFECGDGTTLLLYGRPSPNKGDHTQVRFWSTDIAADVQDLEARGVEFALGGSGLLLALNLAEIVRDWDITTDAPLGEVMGALAGIPLQNIDTGDPTFASAYHLLAEPGGIEIDISGSLAMRTDDGICHLPTVVSGYWNGVPVGSPEVWAVAYRLMGRDAKAGLLSNHIRSTSARGDIVRRLLAEPLPADISYEVRSWPVSGCAE